MLRNSASYGLLFGAILFASPMATSAQSLDEVVARVYTKNPELNAQRAGVRASDENVAAANAGFQPRVSVFGSAGGNQVDYNAPGYPLSGTQQLVPRNYGLSVVQNLYNGEQTSNQVRIADVSVLGARSELAATESAVLLDAVTKYMDVIRDISVSKVMQNNLEVIQEQLRQTQIRFDIGDVNNTALAQVKAQLALAEADLNTAKTNLSISRSSFEKVVGIEPKDLKPIMAPVKKLPHSLSEVLALADKNNPKIIAAGFNQSASELNVDLAAGALRPTVDVVGTASQQWDYQFQNDKMSDLSLMGKITVTLYEGGEANAHIRRAKELLAQTQLGGDAIRAAVRNQATAAWQQLENSNVRIRSANMQIESAQVALNGTRSEFQVGQATTLDVLISAQNQLSAQINRVTAEHDQVVSAYQVMALTGQLTAAELGVHAKVSDPKAHYDATHQRIFGTDISAN